MLKGKFTEADFYRERIHGELEFTRSNRIRLKNYANGLLEQGIETDKAFQIAIDNRSVIIKEKV